MARTVPPEVAQIVDKILALSQLPPEQQETRQDEFTPIQDAFQKYHEAGVNIIRSYSTDEGDTVIIANNPILSLMIAAAQQLMPGMTSMFLDYQSIYAVVSVTIGALIEAGALKALDAEPPADPE